MCEWTPPCETSPSRWTFAPRARARSKTPTSAGFSKNEPSSIALVDPLEVLERGSRPEPIVRCPTSELPIWPGGRPTASPEASSVVCGYSAQSRSNTGRVRELDRVAGAGRGDAPAVEDDERDERELTLRCGAAQIAANESRSSEAPPTSAPSTSGCERSSSALSGFTEPPYRTGTSSRP